MRLFSNPYGENGPWNSNSIRKLVTFLLVICLGRKQKHILHKSIYVHASGIQDSRILIPQPINRVIHHNINKEKFIWKYSAHRHTWYWVSHMCMHIWHFFMNFTCMSAAFVPQSSAYSHTFLTYDNYIYALAKNMNVWSIKQMLSCNKLT